jgi:hypothetical protein
MAKFRESHSGQIYEFAHPYDVEQMRKHPDYVEVLEAAPEVKPQELKAAKTTKE